MPVVPMAVAMVMPGAMLMTEIVTMRYAMGGVIAVTRAEVPGLSGGQRKAQRGEDCKCEQLPGEHPSLLGRRCGKCQHPTMPSLRAALPAPRTLTGNYTDYKSVTVAARKIK